MYVSVCRFCGKVFQIGRGVSSYGNKYCCAEHAKLDRPYEMRSFGTPSEQIKRKGGGGSGSGYWETEDDGLFLTEDGGRWIMEDYD